MKEAYSYEELKEQISEIKTPKDFIEKEISLKYKISASYYNHSITKIEKMFYSIFLYIVQVALM